MRASLRWNGLLLGGLLLVPGAALAQSAPDPAPSSTPATDAVGPQELQNFSLSGKVTKPSDQQAAPAPGPSAPATSSSTADQTRTATAPVRHATPPREQPRQAAVAISAPATTAKPAAQAPLTAFTPSLSAPPPASTPSPTVDTPVAQTAVPATAVPVPTTESLAPEHRLLIWPWLLAALVLAGATLFLLWRRRQQAAFAGPQFDLFVPPEPAPRPQAAPAPPRASAPPVAPAPQPAPTPPKPAAPASTGIVSTRLRPSLEIGVQPVRCIVEEDRIVLDFELELYNSGTAPARAVLAEASLFNAGATQDKELAAFFANPVGAGERLDAIPPMKRVTFTNQVVAPRSGIQEYELGGRKVFVPIIAFNALYLWSGGHAQTSAAYLVGRDTGREKLGPLSLERGPRQIGKLAGKLLPVSLQT